MSELKCGSCKLCCSWPTTDRRVRLSIDELNMYEHDFVDGKYLLAVKPGTTECHYLNEEGCAIHSFAPTYCKEFDCRTFHRTMSDEMVHMSMMVVKGLEKDAENGS